MGYDYPECFIGYNRGGYNNILSNYGDDDVTICLECLFDKLLYDCELKGRSRHYALQNITKYETCWMCKKVKRLLYENIPISKCYREEYDISIPDEDREESYWDESNNYKYSCLNCFENKGLILFDDDLESYATDERNCNFCDKTSVACLIVR
jgi:hypothetical protein